MDFEENPKISKNPTLLYLDLYYKGVTYILITVKQMVTLVTKEKKGSLSSSPSHPNRTNLCNINSI